MTASKRCGLPWIASIARPPAQHGGDLEAPVLEKGLHEPQDRFVVVDDQDVARGAQRRARLERRGLAARRVRPERKQHAEAGSRAGLARQLDRSAMAAHDAEHRRETEPPPGEARREEGLEDVRLVLRGDADARVPHFEVGVLPRADLERSDRIRERFRRDPHAARAQRDVARPALERLAGVRHQIEDHPPQLHRISLHRGSRARARCAAARTTGSELRQRSSRSRASAPRSTAARSCERLPAATCICSVRSTACSAAARISGFAASGESGGSRPSTRRLLPRITVSRLLKSWARPPARDAPGSRAAGLRACAPRARRAPPAPACAR